jgi:hypothetical protein
VHDLLHGRRRAEGVPRLKPHEPLQAIQQDAGGTGVPTGAHDLLTVSVRMGEGRV